MAEFGDVVRRRRMTRAFRADPVASDLLERFVDLASRAPSAGKTQGWHLVVLDGAETSRFWDITFPVDRRPGFRWSRLLQAPVIALAFADPQAYVERYSEPDKASARSDAGVLGNGTDAWSAPYWTIDASMAVMTLLLAAEDAGLGALFFGVFHGAPALRAELDVPEHLQLLGAIALGVADATDPDDQGRSASRPRRPVTDIIHRGGW